MAYAHSRNPRGERHLLSAHLDVVAETASAFAGKFDGSAFARMAGLLHDIGKANPAFQEYLTKCEQEPERRHPTVDHKGAGTVAALEFCDDLAFLVQGHHGGLPDRSDLKTRVREIQRLNGTTAALAVAKAEGLVPSPAPGIGELYPAFATEDELSCEFFLRMAFSALVDADHLDTERHFSPEQANVRDGVPSLDTLAGQLRNEQTALSGHKDDPVNRVRDEVYRACLSAAQQEPGFFRLTVPTGGGKTRSGLAFALEHAVAHGLHRVIVAVPYLTITDQTADVCRSVLGNDRAVLEHHSGLRSAGDEGDLDPEQIWRRLAIQNWDAPVIVTTTVQLFESLLGRTPSACRKLHRLARSVILLDEVQTLPPPLLEPILSVLQELVTNYGTSVILCTATQPAFAKAPGFEHLQSVREIVPNADVHFRTLQRVRYEWPALEDSWTWAQVAHVVRSELQSLTIVNTKSDALALLDALDDPDALHLSTLLCGAHRRDILAIIRRRLERGDACRVVSTQVVEAGVDIDFPVVLRALGPLDRIVQAAGRCNREGRLDQGRVVIFEPAEGGMPRGPYRTATDATRALLSGGIPDVSDPVIFERYFDAVFSVLTLDAKGVQRLRSRFAFEAVAKAFRLIDDDTIPVIVPYFGLKTAEARQAALTEVDHEQQVARLLRELEQPATARDFAGARDLFARAQPYIVALRRYHAEQVERQGLITELRAGLWRWNGGYDLTRGVVAPRDPEEFVI